jgi:malonyl-CoA O-methyltransferase
VARRFDAAAERYESHAEAQFEAATALARRIGALDLPARPRLLEIGCGTGFLGRALEPALPGAQWLFSDISPAMLRRCRHAWPGGQAAFVAMDGELPCIAPGPHFDLICSSLAFQWFEALPAAIADLTRLLAPGGWLVFATLGRESFEEWRIAARRLGQATGLHDYPSAAELHACWPTGGSGQVAEDHLARHYADAWGFLRELRAIGADLPAAGTPRQSPGELRRVLRALDGPDGFTTRFHILYGTWRSAGS